MISQRSYYGSASPRQIEDLLIRLDRHRLEIGAFRDSNGNLRLLMRFPAWEGLFRLAFDEIRLYGANSVRVMRGMNALLNQLIFLLLEERRPALHYWRQRLQSQSSVFTTTRKIDLMHPTKILKGLAVPAVKHQAVSLLAGTRRLIRVVPGMTNAFGENTSNVCKMRNL